MRIIENKQNNTGVLSQETNVFLELKFVLKKSVHFVYFRGCFFEGKNRFNVV